ncbi:MAG: hypothetical protein AAGK78_01335, partial [Planctomycetota bacterium]
MKIDSNTATADPMPMSNATLSAAQPASEAITARVGGSVPEGAAGLSGRMRESNLQERIKNGQAFEAEIHPELASEQHVATVDHFKLHYGE